MTIYIVSDSINKHNYLTLYINLCFQTNRKEAQITAMNKMDKKYLLENY